MSTLAVSELSWEEEVIYIARLGRNEGVGAVNLMGPEDAILASNPCFYFHKKNRLHREGRVDSSLMERPDTL